MVLTQWYELRVDGSAGTKAGLAKAATEGIAIADSGRLCSIASGHARKFESRQQAIDYLGKVRVSGEYRFEAVQCYAAADAKGASALHNAQPVR